MWCFAQLLSQKLKFTNVTIQMKADEQNCHLAQWKFDLFLQKIIKFAQRVDVGYSQLLVIISKNCGKVWYLQYIIRQ